MGIEIEKHKYIIVTLTHCTHYTTCPLKHRILHHPHRHWTRFFRKLPIRTWTVANSIHLRLAGKLGYRSICRRGILLPASGKSGSSGGHCSNWGRIRLRPCCTCPDRRWRWWGTGGRIECTYRYALSRLPRKWRELPENWILIDIPCPRSRSSHEVSPVLRGSVAGDLTMAWFPPGFLIRFCTIFS